MPTFKYKADDIILDLLKFQGVSKFDVYNYSVTFSKLGRAWAVEPNTCGFKSQLWHFRLCYVGAQLL